VRRGKVKKLGGGGGHLYPLARLANRLIFIENCLRFGLVAAGGMARLSGDKGECAAMEGAGASWRVPLPAASIACVEASAAAWLLMAVSPPFAPSSRKRAGIGP